MRAALKLWMMVLVAWIAAAQAQAAQVPQAAQTAGRGPLILVSIDAFRPDFLHRGLTPALDALASEGVSATMRPSFPTLTFPNHYTLVTGLYPDHHGIVANTMEDPATGEGRFTNAAPQTGLTDGRWWDAGEPIWVTARRQGIRTATMFWPGSEAQIRGLRPDYWRSFDKSLNAAARVDQVLAWLDLPPGRRPGFITLYIDIVDVSGHAGGPGSRGVRDAVAEADAAVGRLTAGLKARGLYDQTNLIVLSDHGLADISPRQVLYVDDWVPAEAIHVTTAGPLLFLSLTDRADPGVEGALLAPRDHVQCWTKDKVPARFHYGSNPRVTPIVCQSEVGWSVTTHAKAAAAKKISLGDHGFDPDAPTMRAMFLARGPAFRRGAAVPMFDNVDVYPLMAKALGVRPRPSDGRLQDVAALLNR